MSGTMSLGGQQVHVHCGGHDAFQNKTSRECFALRMDSSGTLLADRMAALPEEREFSCSGSDGSRFVVAGGRNDNNYFFKDVLVLEGVTSKWAEAAVKLPTLQRSSAGVLLGDLLVCMGGLDAVGWRRGGPFFLCWGLPACAENLCCGPW